MEIPSDYGEKDWLPATVPGGVHTDLLALGKIPDPFVADNEKKVQWIGETDWEYRYEYNAAPEVLKEAKQILVCDGLDTLSEVSSTAGFLVKRTTCTANGVGMSPVR